jgi:hypothetical protein
MRWDTKHTIPTPLARVVTLQAIGALAVLTTRRATGGDGGFVLADHVLAAAALTGISDAVVHTLTVRVAQVTVLTSGVTDTITADRFDGVRHPRRAEQNSHCAHYQQPGQERHGPPQYPSSFPCHMSSP